MSVGDNGTALFPTILLLQVNNAVGDVESPAKALFVFLAKGWWECGGEVFLESV